MELGTLTTVLAVLGIVGALGIVVAWGLRVSGLSDIVQIFLGFMGNFLQMIGRLISYAPKGIQVFIFFTVGISFVGLMTNWVMAADKVCADGNLYQTNSFISGTIAKSLPGRDPLAQGGEELNGTVNVVATSSTDISVLESDAPLTGTEAVGLRSAFIEEAGVGQKSQFTRLDPTNDMISYSCDPDDPDEVQVGMFGYPVFTPTGIMIISSIFGLFGLLKTLNVF